MANPNKYYLTAKYDFAVDGGVHTTTGHITLADNSTIPNNAIVTDVTMYTSTDVAGSSSTLQLIMGTTGNTTNDVAITAVIAEATFADESVQVDSTGGKALIASVVKLDIGTANLTGGVVEITLGYFIGTAE